jgi:Dolichyl-phosphate-mannose-protein mannosyltransferase
MLQGVLVTALCGAFFFQGLLASRVKSPTNDEPVHIVSGAAYIVTRKIVANPQHPPLMKELAGLSLALARIKLHGAEKWPAGFEWSAAQPFLISNGVSRILFWARLPLLLLSPLLGLLIYWWGRELAGARAGLCALFLFAFDPTMVAHSYLVTTDFGAGAFSLLFLFALYRYCGQPGAFRLVVAGVTLGLALCAKFSALFLLPVAALLLIAACPGPRVRRGGTAFRLGYALAAWAAIVLVAVFIIQILYFSPRGPLLYLHGLRTVNADHNPNTLHYLAGQLKTRFASYFAVAWLVKEPLATSALALTGAILVLRSRSIPRLSKLFLLLPPAIFFMGCVVLADDLGVRYLIPAMTFAYLAGGIALGALWKGGLAQRAVATIACAWVITAAAGTYPDHLSYFNEAACLPAHPNRIGWDGGSRCGPDWLADSNVDWGQSLPKLKTWMDRHYPGQIMRLAYFGSFPPEAYGIHAGNAYGFLGQERPPRGIYAISAHEMAFSGARGGASWMREEPAAIVGHSYFIFNVDF